MLLDRLADHRWFRVAMIFLVILIAVGYRLAKAFLANRVEASDLDTLRLGAEMALQGKNVWSITLATWSNTHFFAYPAGMLIMAVFMLRVSQVSGLSFLHVAQLLGLTFDVLVALMVYVILRKEKYYSRLLGLTLVVFNPFLFRNSMFKAKPDDAIMLFIILTSFDLFERGRSSASSIVFGLGVAFKQFTVLLFPYFIMMQRTGKRLRALLLVAAGFILGSLPGLGDPLTYLWSSYLIHAYRQSENFQWGTFAGCWETFAWCVPVSLAIFALVMTFIYLMFHRTDPYTFAFLIAFAFIAFYWVAWEQYFTWFVPFVVIAIMRRIGSDSSGQRLTI
jgi:uncharacterized membrane protein